MPLFDYECEHCGFIFEFLHIKTTDSPICPRCSGMNNRKLFTAIPQIRMDSDSILRSMPDPSPPLTELTPQKGSESGMKDLPRTELKDYTRTKDKHGNSVWREKRRTYFGAGGDRRSSAERRD